MAWKIEFTPAAAKQLKKIGPENGWRIIGFLQGDIRSNPRKHGKVLKGALREFWRYSGRKGDRGIMLDSQHLNIGLSVRDSPNSSMQFF